MIRNAVIHITNEQPMLADLFSVPSAGDLTLVCTNLRTMNGKRPIFVDHSDSVFVFPFIQIRFLEIPPGAATLDARPTDAAVELPPGAVLPSSNGSSATSDRDAGLDADLDLAIDEDFLRRVRDA